jgi:phosphatidylinositol-3-phosphatase
MKVRSLRNRIQRFIPVLCVFSTLITFSALTGCGGSSSSMASAPAPSPSPAPGPSPSPSSTPPSIATQPQSQTVTAPATATFTVAAKGSTPLTYQWNENGNPISGATSSSYTTPPTAGSDNGDKFTVVITNSAGTVASNAASLTVNSGSSPTIPQFSHVFVVLEENHSFSDVIGNADMPYLNGLASANSLATQYYADAHPSLPNYFELTVGEGTSITGTSGDSYSGVVTQDNVVRALTAAGKTWKSYAESLPSTGYLGGDTGAYLQHHNPVVYFSDVQQNSLQAENVVPFGQLATDIANDALPDYGFIVPNVNDDAHNCPAGMPTCTDTQKLAAADQWLSANIAPLLASSAFQNSLLIIVFDEAEDSDTAHGGGHVPAILVSPLVHSGYQSTTLYQHESTLRLMMEALGATDLPGAAATAPDMTEFFP